MDYVKIAEGLRREAYVKALTVSIDQDNIVGIIGSAVPYEIPYSMGLVPLPVYGIDKEILDYSVEDGFCSMVDATLTYGKQDKCPLIHSAKLLIVDDTCEERAHAIEQLRDYGKKVYVYRREDEDAYDYLIFILEAIYGVSFSEGKLNDAIEIDKKINQNLEQLKKYTPLTGLEIYSLEFFSRFLFSQKERLEFLKQCVKEYTEAPQERKTISLQGGGGIYKKLDEEGMFVIEEGQYCEGKKSCPNEQTGFSYLDEMYGTIGKEANLKYVYESCCLYNGLEIKY